jgi:hypothetical protein
MADISSAAEPPKLELTAATALRLPSLTRLEQDGYWLQPLTDHTRHLAREFHAVRARRHGLSQAAGQDSARRHQLLRNRSGLPPA